MNMKNYLVRADAIKMSGTSNITFKNACKRLGIEPLVKEDENGKEKFYYKKSDVERIKNITNPVINPAHIFPKIVGIILQPILSK